MRPALANADIVNNGVISGAAPQQSAPFAGGGNGVDLLGANGTLINTGTIAGGGYAGANGNEQSRGGDGVLLAGARGTLLNTGIITGGRGAAQLGGGIGVSLTGAGDALTNQGTILSGSGGPALNMSGDTTATNGGLIAGGAYPVHDMPGIRSAAVLLQGAATLTNTGTIRSNIAGYVHYAGAGVNLDAGATLINAGVIDGGNASSSGGNLSGYTYYPGGNGVSATGSGYILNTGTIRAGLSYGGRHDTQPNGDGVLLSGIGVSMLNRGLITAPVGAQLPPAIGAAAVIRNGATLTNDGTLSDAVVAAGARLSNNGQIYGGVAISGGMVTNTGTIETRQVPSDANGFGPLPAVSVTGSGNVSNAGLILGASNAAPGNTTQIGDTALSIDSTGKLANTGTLQGGVDAVGGTGLVLDAGTVVNAGLIAGGASVTGTGDHGGDGAIIAGGTLITAGLIAGGLDGATRADAVSFTGAGTLAIYAGARFEGGIAAAAGSNATLELLASAQTGTLAGLGSAITGIANITEANGASWVVSSPGSFAAGSTLTVNGDLTIAGNFSDAGTAVIGASGTLIAENFSSLATLSFAGPGELILGPAALPINAPGLIEGFSDGDTLALSGLQASSFSYSDGTLDLYGPRGVLIGALNFAGTYTQSDFSVQGSFVTFAGGAAHL